MKRFLVLLFGLFLVFSLNAQDHLTFKGIPIEGKESDFVSKLEKQGFEIITSTNSGTALKGPFVGFDDCTILVISSKQTKTVWKVVAHLPEQASWSSTRSRYEDFIEKYTNKYGAPTDNYEFFVSPYERGDGYELQAISLEKGFYSSYWTSELGTIVVEIEAKSNSRGYVSLGYEDAKGVAIMRAEKNAMIEDDI